MTLSRRRTQLRPVTLEPFVTAAPGSVLITQGGTRVLCTASIARDTPAWLIDPATGQAARGWVTAEYAMLPGSTRDRKRRGADGRSTEIQRFIGRALRAAVDLTKMPGVTITCDCDVLCADGGTRTAAITGAFVALAQAIRAARKQGLIQRDPILGPVAAVSVGLVDSRLHLDLDYALDARAQVDMNVVMNHRGRFIEVQGAGEQGTFSHQELQAMLKLAGQGIRKLMRLQRQVLRGALRS
ncbi:MAG TPA: ribonuclease PH [Phycisphaeraceae bacterium]